MLLLKSCEIIKGFVYLFSFVCAFVFLFLSLPPFILPDSYHAYITPTDHRPYYHAIINKYNERFPITIQKEKAYQTLEKGCAMVTKC